MTVFYFDKTTKPYLSTILKTITSSVKYVSKLSSTDIIFTRCVFVQVVRYSPSLSQTVSPKINPATGSKRRLLNRDYDNTSRLQLFSRDVENIAVIVPSGYAE